jgi:hypothetical protein
MGDWEGAWGKFFPGDTRTIQIFPGNNDVITGNGTFSMHVNAVKFVDILQSDESPMRFQVHFCFP